MADDIVIVARYSYPTEAEIARIRLEAEGIESLIANEFTVHMMFAPGSMGGILLQVRREDFDKATEILGADMPAPRSGPSSSGWQVDDEVPYPGTPAAAFELVKEAFARIGKLTDTDDRAMTVDGTVGGWLNKIKVRVEAKPEADGSILRLSAEGRSGDFRGQGASWALDRLMKELGVSDDGAAEV